jgi:formamidopyrimidine-DNA glycosylase
MPELPEVETVVRGLRLALPGRRILAVRLGKTDFIDDPAALEALLPGRRIAAVRRHGKFFYLELEQPESTPSQAAKRRMRNPKEAPERATVESAQGAVVCLIVHLGMTGQLTTRHADEPVKPHTHVVLTLDDGRELRYTDPRRFGRMLVASESRRLEVLGPLGADPTEVTEEELRVRLRRRSAHIKAVLLDQRVFRGMGNIYTDESLWRARIHPRRLAASLNPNETQRLHRAMQAILAAAIRLGGSSIDANYVDANGEPGEFQIRHRAYGREGKLCARCRAVIRRIIVAGRSSFFCPQCQRAPRRRKLRGRVLAKKARVK